MKVITSPLFRERRWVANTLLPALSRLGSTDKVWLRWDRDLFYVSINSNGDWTRYSLSRDYSKQVIAHLHQQKQWMEFPNRTRSIADLERQTEFYVPTP